MNHDRMVEILNSTNIEETINSLSFEEKVGIIASDLFVARCIVDQLIDKGIKLFNEQESIQVFNSHRYLFAVIEDDIHHKVCIAPVLDLPDEMLIEEYANSEFYGYIKLIKDPLKLLAVIDSLDYNQQSTVFSVLPDEELAKLITRRQYRDQISNIIVNFKSDEYKMRFLMREDRSYRSGTIITMSDENIKKYINPLAPDKGMLISYLDKDIDKEMYLEHYKLMLSSKDKAEIISSFQDENYIIRNLKHLKTEKEKYYFVIKATKLRDKEYFHNIINSINNERYIADIIRNMKYHIDDKFLITLLDKVHEPKLLYELYDYGLGNELEIIILPRLSQKYIHKYVKENMECLNDYHILLYLEDRALLFETLSHYNFRDKYNDDILPLLKIICQKYNLNFEHLVALAKITECTILQQLDNENVRNAINLDEENFQKYLRLFGDGNLELGRNAISAILNSLLNKKFSIEYPDKIQLFIDTLHAIDDGNLDLAVSKINEVLMHIDISHYNINPQQLIKGVLSGNEDIIVIYNRMTYEYLTNERNAYVNGKMEDALQHIMTATYEINGLVKYMLKVLPEDMILKLIDDHNKYGMTPEEEAICNNRELLVSLIRFKKNPQNGLNPEYKQYLKKFNNLLKDIFEDYHYSNSKYAKIEGLPLEYSLANYGRYQLINIIANIDVNKMKDLIFNDPEMFEELLRYIDRYDMLGWQGRFDDIAVSADLDMSANIVGVLISNFDLIMKMKREKEAKGERFTFASELAMADCLDSDASVYSHLFGRDDYRLLRRNPGPNSSPKSKKYRLDKALDLLHTMHDRKYITVPPVDKNYKLRNGKSINIIIGNTNDPINLTYGERTGACMRIGGAGSSLFDFCLKNENGFHISFNHPTTGELISRVSCYRNGNTVFMNQLRYSLNSEYSDKELTEACKLIGKEIIELTKNSKYPVMNVVASNGYALSSSKMVNTTCTNPTRGFIPPFYTDVSERVVVIATATGELSPIELGPSKAERYEVGRGHIRRYDMAKAKNAVVHIEALDAYLGHTPIDEIEVEEKNIAFAYVGEDWYVAITDSGEIINYVSKTSRDAKKLMKKCISI